MTLRTRFCVVHLLPVHITLLCILCNIPAAANAVLAHTISRHMLDHMLVSEDLAYVCRMLLNFCFCFVKMSKSPSELTA